MSADSTRNPHDENGYTAPVAPTGATRPPAAAVDPELLRWRAEMLMDEMMLGGVDVAASAPTVASYLETAPAARTPVEEELRQGIEPLSAALRTRHEPGQNGTYGQSTSAAPEADRLNRPSTDWSGRSSSYPANSSAATPTDHEKNQPSQRWLFSAEERYQQVARTQQTSTAQPSPVDGAHGSSSSPVWMGEDANNAPVLNGASHHESPTATQDNVRRVSTQFAGVMSVANIGVKRSSLLPRMSTANVDALQREIYTLQHEIESVLPAGHESNKHVRHLLDKAQAILQHDPTRSAEVEYYLQQVRTIFPRVQQTIDWSSLYRNRLTVYLSAWILLALLIVVARYLYQAPIENFVGTLVGLAPDGLTLQHFSTLLATFFAGALGGALGALVNLQRQSHMPHGFIDRKFGLRGLILPLMGAIVGLLLYLPLGLLFFVFGLDPAQNLLFSTIPALLALLFGVSQESLYGTRE